MNNRESEHYLAASTSTSIARMIPAPNHSIPKKTSELSMTPNTVVVLCAIAALIAILVFLESRIRHLSIYGASNRGVFLNQVPLRDEPSTVSSSQRRKGRNSAPWLFA
jgi:hypothetical protein